MTVVSTPKAGGGNRVWSCNYCNKKVTGSYSKVKAHLLKIPNRGVEGCKTIFDDALMEVKREYDEVEKRKSNKMLKARTRAEYVIFFSGLDLLQHKKRKSALGALERSFNTTEREEADKDCARMFYTGALSFNFVKNPYFRRFCLRLANNSLAGYLPHITGLEQHCWCKKKPMCKG